MNHLLRLIVLGLCIPFFAQAQNQNVQPNIDLGIYLGMSSHGSDLNSFGRHGQGMMDNSKLAYGIHLGYGLNEKLRLKLQYKGTQIEGKDTNLANKEIAGDQHLMRGYTYRSSLSEIGLILEYELFNLLKPVKAYVEKNTDLAFSTGFNTRKAQISPFIFGGFSTAIISDDENFRSWGTIPRGKEQDVLLDQEQGSKGGFQIPIGAGIRFKWSDNIYTDLFYSARLPVSDYLDGISAAGNEEANDAYQFCGINLGFNLNKISLDSDADGIPDNVDECPNEPGVKTLFGCPDADLDGIMDKYDNCPNVAGLAKDFGCPDSDGDGVIDSLDKCPNQKGLKTNYGCPQGVKIP